MVIFFQSVIVHSHFIPAKVCSFAFTLLTEVIKSFFVT